MKLTDRQVRNLKPKSQRYEEWEGDGLGIRVAPSGRKSWIYMYRFNGTARRMTFGTYPALSVAEAHAVHAQAKLSLSHGKDPGTKLVKDRQEHRNASTVNELAHEYIEKWAKKRKRSWKEDERMLNKDMLPTIGKLKAKEITRRDIIRLLDKIVARGAPIIANRTLEIIRKMFNFAVERGILDISPCLNIRAPSAENQRDRVLSEEEIKLFWHNLDKTNINKGIQLALKLQLITAQRRGETISMEWSEVDLNSGWWTIPAHKAKNNLAHRVPLSPMAKTILAEARQRSGTSLYVFPSPHSDKHISPGAVSRAINRSRKLLNTESFTPHDLRRTVASHMTSTGISRLVVGKILNHVESSITAVYDRHSYDKEKQEALLMWGKTLSEYVKPKLKLLA